MEIRKTPHQSAILFLLTVMAYPGFSQAQESALFGSEWEASLALFFPKVDTNIRVDSQGGLIGTEINLETLGLDQSRVLPALGLAWQPNARHSLWLDYFQPDRSGFSTAAVTIRVGETEFPLNAELSTIFNAKVLAMGYGYSFVKDADRIFGFRIGLNVQDLKFGIATTDGLQQETAQGTAPLPTFGLMAGMRFGERWYLSGDAGYFAAKVDQYDGGITQVTGRIDYKLTDRFLVAAGLSVSESGRFLRRPVRTRAADI